MEMRLHDAFSRVIVTTGESSGGEEEEAETKRGNTTPPLIFQFTAPRLTFLCGLESMHLLPETRYSSL